MTAYQHLWLLPSIGCDNMRSCRYRKSPAVTVMHLSRFILTGCRSIGCVGMKVTIRVVMNEVHATIQINLILYFCNFSISFVSTCICRGTKLRCSLNDNKITKSRCLHSLSSTKFVFYFQRQREITTICYIAELKNK